MTDPAADSGDLIAVNDADCFWFPTLHKCQEEYGEIIDPTKIADPIIPINPTTGVVGTGPIVPDPPNGTIAQIGFTTVALLAMSGNLLSVLRWRGDSSGGTSYYSSWTGVTSLSTGTNWWSLSNTIGKWSNVALFGVASITSILAMTGSASFAGLNESVWIYGVGLGLLFVDALVQIFQFLAMNKLKTQIADDTTNSADEITTMGTIQLAIHNEWLFNVGSMALAGAIMFANKDGWYHAMQKAKENQPEPEEDAPAEGDGEGEEGEPAAEGEVAEEEIGGRLHTIFNL